MMVYTIEQIAEIVHAANIVIQELNGDPVSEHWNNTPDDIKESAIDGVKKVIEDPSVTPKQQHESWMAFKLEQGWVLGDEKDAVAKTHPLLVPYDLLPLHQRVKDAVFIAIVKAVAEL